MQDILKNLQKKSIELDRFLTREEILSFISKEEVKKHFKSLTNLERSMRREFSKEELIDILKIKTNKLGRTPHNTEMNVPQAIVYIHKFGSWENALNEVGLEYYELPPKTIEKPKKTKTPIEATYLYSEKYLINSIRSKANKLKRVPRVKDMDGRSIVDAAYRIFGSWNKAVKVAELPYERIIFQPKREKTIKGREWHEKIGKYKRKVSDSEFTFQQKVISDIVLKARRSKVSINDELLFRLKRELKRLKTINVGIFRKQRNIHYVPSDVYYMNRFEKTWRELIEMLGLI